jgi:Carboxypeptidase regulatory-like domain/TonB dependent receptor
VRNFLKFNLFLTIVAIILSTVPVSGQTSNGTILGTITDSSHAVMANVQVSLTDTGTNSQRSETTNATGYFVFSNLAPGTYRVDVEQPGFQKTVRSDIGLDANTTVRVDLQMTPGAVTETVDVTAETPVLKTDRADTGGQISSGTLDTMPMLHNRNYQSLLEIVPGVQKSYRDHSAFFNSQEHLQSVVNGLDHRNNYMIEGLDNNVEDLTGIIPPADAIANVDVSTANYDPELGRAGGAVTNVVLKSGTNGYHGSAFEYNRVNALQARDPFSTTGAPHAVYNQFGGSFGGRIKRDKLFFFGDYQGSRDVAGQTNIVTFPTLAFRTGDLSASPTTIYDPNTGVQTGSATGTGRMPFPNNRIDPSRISPIAKTLLGFLPPPTSAGLSNNFQENTVQSKPMDQFDTKIDYVIGANDRLFVRYSFQRATVNDPGLYGPNGGIYGGPHNSGFEGSGPSRNQSPGLNYTHILSPTLVTEFRFGIVRNHNQAINVDSGLTTSKDVGIPGVNLDQWSSGLAQINVNNFTTPMLGFSASLPWVRSVTNFNIVNNWTKTKGTQIFKWGIDVRRERQDLLQTQTFNPRGLFVFTGGTTQNPADSKTSLGNSFASFLLDQPNSIGRDLAVIFPARRNTIYNLYFQDKWQVSQKLTVDLGLRWEYWPSSTPHHAAGFSNYDPFNNTLLLAGLGSVPNDLGINSHLTSFGPRIGVAYRFNEKTVFRAGYGISYVPRDTNVYNFPVAQATQFTAPNSFSAAGSMAVGVPPISPVVLPSTGIIVNPPLNQAYTYIPNNLPQGYVESWNVTLQRALPGNFSAEAAFVGNHGVNLPASNNLNINAAQVPGTGSSTQPENILFGRTANTLEPWNAPSYYEALQVRLNRRFSNGFTLFNSYAYGKSIDFNPSTQGAQDYNVINFAANKGLADWDRRNIYTMSAVYELPFGQGKHYLTTGPGKWILGGWQMNALWTWESGLPLDISTNTTSLNAPGNINRPNVNGPVNIPGGIGPGTLYFDTSMFSAPAKGTFGNLGRNVLHGPGLFSIDTSIFRRFPIRERMNLEFRAEAFNVTNRPQYDRPDYVFGDAAFGQVISAHGTQSVLINSSRQLQFSMRLQF